MATIQELEAEQSESECPGGHSLVEEWPYGIRKCTVCGLRTLTEKGPAK